MMKFKPNQTRTYDREGYKKRAACLCFRSEREDEVLLVSSSRYPDQWIVPGGGMEPEEEPGEQPSERCMKRAKQKTFPYIMVVLAKNCSIQQPQAVLNPEDRVRGFMIEELHVVNDLKNVNIISVYTPQEKLFLKAGVKGKLGRLLGIFENQDRKHRTYVYVLTVTEILEDWEDSVNIGRKREWFKVEDAIKVLQCHKPVHAEYLEKLKLSCSPTNGNSVVPPLPDSNSLYVTSAQTSGLPSTVR